MQGLIVSNLPAVVGSVVALAVISGAVVGIVIKALSVHRWLLRQFTDLTASINGLRSAIGERFERHEREEREWQRELAEKVEDVRERLARMEGQLTEAEKERMRRAQMDRRLEE